MHLFSFNDTPAFSSSSNTVHRWSRCCSTDLERMTTSSRYTNADCQLIVDRIISITRCNVRMAYFRPSYILKNVYGQCWDEAVDLSLFQSSISTPRYPQWRSHGENMCTLPCQSKYSFICKIGYASLTFKGSSFP